MGKKTKNAWSQKTPLPPLPPSKKKIKFKYDQFCAFKMKIIVCFKLESDKINLLKLQGHIRKFSLVQFNIEVNFGQKRAKKGLNNSDIEEIFDL